VDQSCQPDDVAQLRDNGGWIWSICPSLAECLDTGQRANLVDNGQFFTDAAAGTLPAYSVVTAGGATDGGVLDSCHNSFSMTACDNYIGQLVTAAENGPDWPSTAIFITFDDCGCFTTRCRPASTRISPSRAPAPR
jgi:phospholipase C